MRSTHYTSTDEVRTADNASMGQEVEALELWVHYISIHDKPRTTVALIISGRSVVAYALVACILRQNTAESLTYPWGKIECDVFKNNIQFVH